MSDTMSGFDCYKAYVAVSNHFSNSSYDFFKYKGNINLKQSSYNARKDKYYFEKAARKFVRDDFIKHLVANILNGPFWIGHLFSPAHEIHFKKWRKRIESLTYQFKQEISYLHSEQEDFNQLFTSEQGKHPLLYRLYSRSEVSLETLVILDDLVNFTRRWRKLDDIFLKETADQIEKYRPFLYHYTNLSKDKFRKIVLEEYQ